MQQVFIQGGIAGEADLAQTVARAAFIDQFDVGDARLRVDRQALADEVAAEVTVARCLVLDQALGVFIMTMVEHRARAQRLAVGNAEGFEFAGRAIDADSHITQVHRLAGIDVQYQLRPLVGLGRWFDLAVDLRLVITQGLSCLARLLDCAAAEAQQRLFIAFTKAADIAFDIGLEFVIGRFDPDHQLALRIRADAGKP
ncbi:hypothetical protein D3C76_928980 [compost metagenome]